MWKTAFKQYYPALNKTLFGAGLDRLQWVKTTTKIPKYIVLRQLIQHFQFPPSPSIVVTAICAVSTVATALDPPKTFFSLSVNLKQAARVMRAAFVHYIQVSLFLKACETYVFAEQRVVKCSEHQPGNRVFIYSDSQCKLRKHVQTTVHMSNVELVCAGVKNVVTRNSATLIMGLFIQNGGGMYMHAHVCEKFKCVEETPDEFCSVSSSCKESLLR
ncbi:hypothetical protein T265_15596, partial [Opisthorchis viverrini]